jgi:hypothetical protein
MLRDSLYFLASLPWVVVVVGWPLFVPLAPWMAGSVWFAGFSDPIARRLLLSRSKRRRARAGERGGSRRSLSACAFVLSKGSTPFQRWRWHESLRQALFDVVLPRRIGHVGTVFRKSGCRSWRHDQAMAPIFIGPGTPIQPTISIECSAHQSRNVCSVTLASKACQ